MDGELKGSVTIVVNRGLSPIINTGERKGTNQENYNGRPEGVDKVLA